LNDALLSNIFIDKGDPAPDQIEAVVNAVSRGEMMASQNFSENFGFALAGGSPVMGLQAAGQGAIAPPSQMIMKMSSPSSSASSPAAASSLIVGLQAAGQEAIAAPPSQMMMTMSSSLSSASAPAASQQAWAQAQAAAFVAALRTYLRFHIFYHPHTCELIRRLNRQGIPGFMAREAQQLTNESSTIAKQRIFYKQYKPSADVHWNYPLEDIDFRQEGSYSLYNWELFFHVPLLIADRLRRDQQFQHAMNWYHLIFDPMTSSNLPTPARYWKTRPFFENSHPEKQQIVTLLKALDPDSPDKATRDDVKKQIARWRTDPFKPHLIARMRLTAYQKTVVMKYIDNLIAWGDQLFSRDTIESINEATQLYILAYNILGARPTDVPQRGQITNKTYNELAPNLDSFSNALVQMENEFPFDSASDPADADGGAGTDGLGTASAFYFCIPKNEKLLGYWDTVEDRLFKIRNCMNIEGMCASYRYSSLPSILRFWSRRPQWDSI
jgi:hypothetical protein